MIYKRFFLQLRFLETNIQLLWENRQTRTKNNINFNDPVTKVLGDCKTKNNFAAKCKITKKCKRR